MIFGVEDDSGTEDLKSAMLKPIMQPLYDTEPISRKGGRHRPRRCRSHRLKVAWKKWNVAQKAENARRTM